MVWQSGCSSSYIGQPSHKAFQIETTIKKILKFCKISWNMFFLKGMKSSSQRIFQIPEYRINPFERGMLNCFFPSSDNMELMGTFGLLNSLKTDESVGNNI